MNKNKLLIAVLALLLVGAGGYLVFFNKPNSTFIETSDNPAAIAARNDLAGTLSIEAQSIVIQQITAETWNDSCLGLGGPAESCLQALVPGFRVEMSAKGTTHIYRTDATGSVVRAEKSN